MRNIVRRVLTFILLGVFLSIAIAVVGEFFIEVAKEKGWYNNASDTWDGAMSAVLSFVASPMVYVPLVGLSGAVFGLWLDAGLRYFEKRSVKSGEIDWDFLQEELQRVKVLILVDQDGWDQVPEGYSKVSQETLTGFFGLVFYLHKHGMTPQDGVPDPRRMTDTDFFIEYSTRYIAAIEPFVRAQDADLVKSFGNIGVKIAEAADSGTKTSTSEVPKFQSHRDSE
jgi:hypothetical protein